MPVRHDYICENCDVLIESYGEPTDPCENCDAMQWKLVFTTPPETRTEHASTVEHIISENAKKMDEIKEEDMSSGSDYQNNIRAVTHTHIH